MKQSLQQIFVIHGTQYFRLTEFDLHKWNMPVVSPYMHARGMKAQHWNYSRTGRNSMSFYRSLHEFTGHYMSLRIRIHILAQKEFVKRHI